MNRPAFADRAAIEAHQLKALRELIAVLRQHNRFYGPKLKAADLDASVASIDAFVEKMPLSTKQQVVDDQQAHPPFGTNLTFPLEHYCRFSQTSGSTDQPLRWLDTPSSWQWMCDNWKQVFEAAAIESGDRVFFAFSFGPFLGFWTAFEAATQMGLLSIPGGGMSSAARLHALLENQATVLCCTPTYAMRLAEVASEQQIDLNSSQIRCILVAGEPGGSVAAIRAHIERHWPGAHVFDHHGMTEVGPVSFQNRARPGVLHIIEYAYMAEVIDPETGQAVAPGQCGELVLTTLGRTACPLLRYRTGDLVRPSREQAPMLVHPELALEGGILGRCDDMVLVRGVNVYPSAIDQIVRAHDEVAEYRVEVLEGTDLTKMTLDIEPLRQCPDVEALCASVCQALHNALQLRIPVSAVEPGSLPRYEMKSRRWTKTTRPSNEEPGARSKG